MHNNHGNRDHQFENYKYMAFFIILDTTYGSHLWSVPSKFQIFWSPATQRCSCDLAPADKTLLRPVKPNLFGILKKNKHKNKGTSRTYKQFKDIINGINICKGPTKNQVNKLLMGIHWAFRINQSNLASRTLH